MLREKEGVFLILVGRVSPAPFAGGDGVRVCPVVG